MVRRPSVRSAMVPSSGRSSDGGKSPASRRKPTAAPLPVSSVTKMIRATRPSESPRNDTTRASHSCRNAGFRRSSDGTSDVGGEEAGDVLEEDEQEHEEDR